MEALYFWILSIVPKYLHTQFVPGIILDYQIFLIFE